MAFPFALQKLLVSYVLPALGLYLLARLLHNRYRSGLRSIPGPNLAGYSDLWRLYDCMFHTPHETLIKLHHEYHSPLVRIGPQIVSVSDPALIPRIYGPNSKFEKTEFYDLALTLYDGRYRPGLIAMREEASHARHRDPIAHAYSMSAMVHYEPLIDSTIALFMTRFDEIAASGKPADIGLWLQMFAFDVLGEIVLSKKIGFLETSSDVDGVIANMRSKTRFASSFGQSPKFAKFLAKNPLLAPSGHHPVVKFTADRMDERKQKEKSSANEKTDVETGKGQSRDFLSHAYNAQAKHGSDVMSDDFIAILSSGNIFAGTETTAITLRAILYYLMKSPVALKRLQQEIDSAKLSETITFEEASSLPYLQACIKEAIRMHPAVGLLLERYVPKGGVIMARRYFLPAGTIVGVNPWVMARNKDVYGQDVDVFRPERWLDASEEKKTEMENANMAFGHGKRSCIGKNISLLEINKVIPMLLRRYEFEFPKEGHEWKVSGGWFVHQDDFLARIKRR